MTSDHSDCVCLCVRGYAFAYVHACVRVCVVVYACACVCLLLGESKIFRRFIRKSHDLRCRMVNVSLFVFRFSVEDS